MTEDTRHLSKVREAESRTISNPGNTKAIDPPAQRKVEIITPARFAGRTMTGRGAISSR
jgi:hypothetical protein